MFQIIVSINNFDNQGTDSNLASGNTNLEDIKKVLLFLRRKSK